MEKNSKGTLLEKLEKPEELIEHIPIGLYRFHSEPSGKWVHDYVSKRFCEIYGISREDVLRDANVTLGLVHPDDKDALIKAILEAVKRKVNFCHQARYIINNEIRWIEAESYPKTLGGEIVYWDGIVQDITKEKKPA